MRCAQELVWGDNQVLVVPLTCRALTSGSNLLPDIELHLCGQASLNQRLQSSECARCSEVAIRYSSLLVAETTLTGCYVSGLNHILTHWADRPCQHQWLQCMARCNA